jgi:chorismate dehydratase
MLKKRNPQDRLLHGVPSSLLSELLNGGVDAALLPVVDLLAHPELEILTHLGVATDGAVKSVLLKCAVPVDQVVSVQRDSASATSNVLAHLLLEKHFGRKVEWVQRGAVADAVVQIGDRALCSEKAVSGDVDLGAAWKEMTGLPFVFAVWAVRKDSPYSEALAHRVVSAYEEGQKHISEMADYYMQTLGFSNSFWMEYLSETIHYQLADQELAGMELFERLRKGEEGA